jgi:hypothetical protein
MINYIEKGEGLHRAISDANYSLERIDNSWHATDQGGNKSASVDAAVQAIIDSYDPLPEAQAEALQRVKEASATKRLEFVTQAAGKDAEYAFKAQEAAQFDIDGSVGVFMQGRINATGDTAAEVAAIWGANAAGWMQVGAAISGLEDKASKDIGAETNWQQCNVLADAIIAQIEAI